VLQAYALQLPTVALKGLAVTFARGRLEKGMGDAESGRCLAAQPTIKPTASLPTTHGRV
jgi:hypothetical protein